VSGLTRRPKKKKVNLVNAIEEGESAEVPRSEIDQVGVVAPKNLAEVEGSLLLPRGLVDRAAAASSHGAHRCCAARASHAGPPLRRASGARPAVAGRRFSGWRAAAARTGAGRMRGAMRWLVGTRRGPFARWPWIQEVILGSIPAYSASCAR